MKRKGSKGSKLHGRVDYEPRTSYTARHEEAYASLLRALAKELHAVGRQLDMCISDWSILTNFSLYSSTGVDRMMSMGSTYSGINATSDMSWVIQERTEGVSLAQLAVGIGSVSMTPHPNDPGYNWTETELREFVTWLEQRGVRHIDLWRADLNTLNPVDGTRPWIYASLASFLQPTPRIDRYSTSLKSDDSSGSSTAFGDVPLHSLADIRDKLGNHTLYKAMGSACDWLVSKQILTAQLPSSICHSKKPIGDWRGAFVGDYKATRGLEHKGGCVFSPEMGPFWHVGQAAKALSLASSAAVPEGVPAGHTDAPRKHWKEASELAGDFLLRQIREDGLVVGAMENSNKFPQTSTALEGLDALFVLANLTSNSTLKHIYVEAGVTSANWYANNVWVNGTGLMWDFWDLDRDAPVTNGTFDYFRLPLPQLPAPDDGSLIDAWVAAGRPLAADSPLLPAYDDMLERLLRDEHPHGNWDAYLLCDGRSDVLCHRRAYWWGGIPFLKSYEQTGNATHLDAAARVGEWYLLAQRLDGGVFRQTTADGRTKSFGLANSAAAAAAIVWMLLFQATGNRTWLDPAARTLEFLLTQQIRNASDPMLEGAMIESVSAPPGGTDEPPWFVRDIASTFAIHAFAMLLKTDDTTVPPPGGTDWLLSSAQTSAPVTLTAWSTSSTIAHGAGVSGIELSNGLISRRFTTAPDFATWAYTSFLDQPVEAGGTPILRTITPEAFVDLAPAAGAAPIRAAVGGLNISSVSSPDEPYSTCFMNYSAATASAQANISAWALHYHSHRLAPMRKDYNWKPGARGSPTDAQWPPLGAHLVVTMLPGPAAPALLRGVTVEVHYEMYQGLPALSKWLTVSHAADAGPAEGRQQLDSVNMHKQDQAKEVEGRRSVVRAQAREPPENQQGRVNIQPCSLKSNSSHSLLWQLSAAPAGKQQGGLLRLAAGLCLAAVHGSALHGYNNMLDVVACDNHDGAQRWLWPGNASASSAAPSLLQSAMNASRRAQLWTPGQGCPDSGECCVDINAHSTSAGVTLQGFSCAGGDCFTWLRRKAAGSTPTGYYQLQAAGLGPATTDPGTAMCMAFTPQLPAPPPPPAPPGPPPSPNPRRKGPVLLNCVVEQLATNQPYTYMAYDPSPEYGGGRAASASPSYWGSGKLHLEIDMEYATVVQWVDTYSVAGSSQPLLTASFDENLNIPLAELTAAAAGDDVDDGTNFVSFRLIELVLDDGPEMGSVRAVQPGSVNNGGAEVSGKYGEGLDVKGVVNERIGLARRRMLKTLAPQILEAPLFFHLDGGGGPGGAAEFEAAVEQVAAVGFDMIIYSFGSGFAWESTDRSYIADIANRTRRAKAKGIEVAGYDLIAWTRNPPDPGWIATDPVRDTRAQS
jgi:hypothetical protein